MIVNDNITFSTIISWNVLSGITLKNQLLYVLTKLSTLDVNAETPVTVYYGFIFHNI